MDPNMSFASLATAVLDPKEASLWTLASILFDPVEETDPYSAECMRMNSLSTWLSETLLVLDVPEMATLSALPILNALIASGNLNAAVSAALDSGHPRFAAVIAGCAAADPPLRKTCFTAQLAAWKPHMHRIPQEHILVLQLLSGQHEQVEKWMLADKSPCIHWLLRLSMRFWFGLGEHPAERLAFALDVLSGIVDVRCSLMALYLHANYHMPSSPWSALSIDNALSWKAFVEISHNLLTVVRISWLLARRLGGKNETIAALQSQLAEQLEATGEPAAALSLLVSTQARSQLIVRHYDLLAASMEPSKELMEALASKLASEGASPVDQFSAFASCQDWPSAIRIFAQEVGPKCVLDGNDEVLRSCLSMFPDHVFERPSQSKINLAAVSAFKAFYPTSSEFDPHRSIKLISEAMQRIPTTFLKEHLPIRVALSCLASRLAELKAKLGLDDASLDALPLSSDSHIKMASMAIGELLSS